MQQFKSRGRVYSLPDTATHAAPGVVCGVYFKRGDKWFYIGDYQENIAPIQIGENRGFYNRDIVELKPKRNPFEFWNRIKGAIFK
ncbi:hypothetical protein [Klebsiella phage pKP-BS317-1.1]|nr:hypothetical protein [Klebsiella phage pKP-BS317-1.1]